MLGTTVVVMECILQLDRLRNIYTWETHHSFKQQIIAFDNSYSL